MASPLRVEIWSDVVCPWCYIGKRRFERALAELDGEIDVEITYRPYQLDPTAPFGAPTPVSEVYAKKFGGPERAEQIFEHVTRIAAEEGLDFHLERAWRANTRDAHRVLWFAEQQAGPGVQSDVKEQLLQAYFTEGLDVGDREVLDDRAAAAGLERGAVAAFLDGTDGVTEVEHDLRTAHERGITAVPTYVIDDAWAIPGAQDSDTFVQVLRRMADKRAGATGGRDDRSAVER
jgi:predicted DsbA family dithiol-disulfide isomerase